MHASEEFAACTPSVSTCHKSGYRKCLLPSTITLFAGGSNDVVTVVAGVVGGVVAGLAVIIIVVLVVVVVSGHGHHRKNISKQY